MTRSLFQLLGLAASLTLMVLSGCATKELALNKALPWSGAKERYETPEKVIAIWTDAVYQLPSKPPTRGFGGRVYFYNADDDVIPVNGQLVVYAFDDSDPMASTDRPSRKYAFTAEQLTNYYSNSDLGASYNIWIPWDEVGGDEKQIALFPVFVDESGKTVRGTFANNRLPGKRVVTEEERRGFYISRTRRQGAQVVSQQESGVRPVSYEEAGPADGATADKEKPGLVTTTIRVPRSLSERMAGGHGAIVPQSPSVTTLSSPAAVPAHPAGSVPGAGPSPASWSSGPHTAQPPADAASANLQVPAASSYPIPATGTAPAPSVLPSAGQSALPPAGQTVPQPALPLGQQGFIGADPQLSTSARSRAWARQDPRAARFEPPQFRAPASPGSRARLARAPLQPSRSTPPYSLPSTP